MSPFILGEWTVHPALNRITRGEETIPVEPRVMHVLACLASRPGDVLSRDDLLEWVWGETIVCEESLTRTISELRRIFGDDPRNPQVIETIRKGGYRLIAPIEPVEGAPAGTTFEALPDTGKPTGVPPLVVWTLVGLIAAAVAVVTIVWPPRSRAPARPTALRGSPFTSYRGHERFPAISPDGTQIAFAWDRDEGSDYDIYVKQRNTESPLQLTDAPENEVYPTWSPDGSTIAFLRGGEEGGIFTIPVLGGPETRLLRSRGLGPGIDWSPDGELLAYSAIDSAGGAGSIRFLSLATRESTVLTHPAPSFQGDFYPAFSPDGRSLAFVRSDDAYMHDIYLTRLPDGEERRATFAQGQVVGIDWTRDGKELIFAAAPSGNFSLWRLRVGDGRVTLLPTQSDLSLCPSVARTGRSMVYEELTFETDVHQINIGRRDRGELESEPLICSTRLDYAPSYSPDGRLIAFISTRTGHREVWVCDSDGGRPRQITRFAGPWILQPQWSPDGRQLAFSVTTSGHFVIHVADLEGGLPRPVFPEDRHQVLFHWTTDGRWLYYGADPGTGWRIWRVSPQGGEPEEAISDGRLIIGPSADHEALVYEKLRDGGLWSRPRGGGEETCLAPGDIIRTWITAIPAPDGIFLTTPDAGGALLAHYTPETGIIDTLLHFPRYSGSTLALSPDGGTMLYDRTDDAQRDLILVEHLQ